MKKTIALLGALCLTACDNVDTNTSKHILKTENDVMEITIRPLDAEESWDMISNNHTMYHTHLKQFYHKPDTFIPVPGNKDMEEMFNKEQLTDKDIEHYRNIFMNELYDANALLRLDDVFQQYVIPTLEQKTNEYLVPLLSSWNTRLPEKLNILYSPDYSSYYNPETEEPALIVFGVNNPSFSAENPFDDKEKIFSLVFHEFVHTLIEIPIIREYGVPQDLKERIVDLICYEFIQRPVREDFKDSFANAYITPEVIRTDLPTAVKKMMSDYNAREQK
ncbi:MAG: hypothetical protein J6Y07_02395 [Alphaproteobacteria bacterium]|nr:hypothetical protein [Alphaproteobacteria bacterium]